MVALIIAIAALVLFWRACSGHGAGAAFGGLGAGLLAILALIVHAASGAT